jgi:hypothetical protein
VLLQRLSVIDISHTKIFPYKKNAIPFDTNVGKRNPGVAPTHIFFLECGQAYADSQYSEPQSVIYEKKQAASR